MNPDWLNEQPDPTAREWARKLHESACDDAMGFPTKLANVMEMAIGNGVRGAEAIIQAGKDCASKTGRCR